METIKEEGMTLFIEVQTELEQKVLLNLEEISIVGPYLGDRRTSITLKSGMKFKVVGTYDYLRDQIEDALKYENQLNDIRT